MMKKKTILKKHRKKKLESTRVNSTNQPNSIRDQDQESKFFKKEPRKKDQMQINKKNNEKKHEQHMLT